MRYSDHIDYLLPSIIYLGTHTSYWARSPQEMARELSLDEARLLAVFEGFPGLYRRSVRVAPHGQHYYALQARCAQSVGMDTSDPKEVSFIPPLDKGKLELVIGFVTQPAGAERTSRRAWLIGGVSMTAAIISAIAAITAAFLRK